MEAGSSILRVLAESTAAPLQKRKSLKDAIAIYDFGHRVGDDRFTAANDTAIKRRRDWGD